MYDSWIANKMINGKKCAFIWHRNDLKISHIDKQVVEVSFLSDRVQQPDTDDYNKLGQVTKYLQSTPDMVLQLQGDSNVKWFVDASYGVHPNTRGHAGGVRCPWEVGQHTISYIYQAKAGHAGLYRM